MVKCKLSDTGNTRYIIDLPEGLLTIEIEFDVEEISYWVEVPGGKTKLADEIGHIIEHMDEYPAGSFENISDND